ncbi:lyase family protein [uncultured Roseobacter sp.]|uniref:lyase family protein n=1 Tax=uncultured Roseobacter sp. TaxID=114847 RepID=UPI00261F13BD|nr:lyase family protein [uncultured Roseobacter sp.]
MAASVFDSSLHAGLFPAGETSRLFSDSAALRAMLLTEGALARAQGKMGLIPEISAQAIQRATLEVQIDPGALTGGTATNGVCIPALVAAFRAEMNAPEHAQYVHWGATSQDIMDTGLMLRLRQALLLAEEDLRQLLTLLADGAEKHAVTVMPARTWGQQATPTTWGAVLAGWGMPLADALDALDALRDSSLWVSLSGAAGTASELGDTPAALRAALAEGLGLRDPGRTWHTDRGPVLRVAGWLAGITATLGSLGEGLTGLAASGISEVRLAGAGASSTMPQKQNPVGPAALSALSCQTAGLMSSLQISATHQHQRDGAAWFTEWMVLPQIVLGCAASRAIALRLLENLEPDPATMRRALAANGGVIYAEALSFALTEQMPRPQSQQAVKDLCAEVKASGRTLAELAQEKWPWLPASLFEPETSTGQAPADARAFVARVRGL